ncbi:MAG: hypothetical protein ACYDHN_13525 [Solirubrobacteraceae bacterium]
MPSSEATPKIIILGLLAQEPDTVAGVQRRLQEQFAAANFNRNSAHSSLPKLAESGAVRLVSEGQRKSLNLYEITSEGLSRLRAWLMSTQPPAIRDALLSKLEFLELEDLPAFLRDVREVERQHEIACRAAHGRVLQQQDVRRRARSRGKPEDWRLRFQGIGATYEVAIWQGMSSALEGLREEVEQMLTDLDRSG